MNERVTRLNLAIMIGLAVAGDFGKRYFTGWQDVPVPMIFFPTYDSEIQRRGDRVGVVVRDATPITKIILSST